MNSSEKEITYQTTNSYSTLNTLTEKTKKIWFVCHGMGYLSRYFLKYFEDLNADDNYIIAPQAQSKYYLPPKFQHVGSSWLTKENTIKETDNVMRYFDAVFENENLPETMDLIVLGYSQGVSVAMRYVASRQLQCTHLILMSGGIPKELKSDDFKFLNAKITMAYGTQDEYLSEERMLHESDRVKNLFGNSISILPFKGKHMLNKELLLRIL